ncbi:MAG: uroporphyrinogen-III synthase [Acidimicrobiia bacterium]
MSTPKVAVTTAADRIAALSAAVSRHGMEAVELPCVEVAAFGSRNDERIRNQARQADWIVVTSARAVTYTWPDGGMPDVPVAAVGPATAAAVAAAGGRTELVGEGGARELVGGLIDRVQNKVVVFPHARGADPGTAMELARAGAHVIALPVYETRPVAPARDPVDAVMFGSPSAVEGWTRGRSLQDLVIAAVGETTASAVARRGARTHVVAAQPDFGLLVADLSRYLKERSPV